MSGHTPGPWAAIGDFVVRPGGYSVAFCYEPEMQGRADDNARFIAAAPYMEEALEIMLASCDLEFSAGGCDECDMGRAALAKARGEA